MYTQCYTVMCDECALVLFDFTGHLPFLFFLFLGGGLKLCNRQLQNPTPKTSDLLERSNLS